MKKNILVSGILFVVAVAGFYSCSRDYTLVSPVSSPAGTAMLRIIDVSPNFRKIYGLADSFNVYVGGIKVTSYTPGASVVMTYNSLFPTVSSAYGYVSVPAGTQQVKLTVSGVVNPDSIPIQTLTKNFVADQLYSFIITDSITSSRDSSQIFVKDSFPTPTIGYYNLRFIHAVLNDTTGKTVDIWSTRNNRYIYTGVKPGSISSFGQMPYNATYSDTLIVRRTGTSFPLDTLPGVSFSNQRTYTVYYKGDGNLAYVNKNAAPVKARHMGVYVHK